METQTMVGLLTRHGVGYLAGIMVAHGYIMGSQSEQFVSAMVLFVTIGWSLWQKQGPAAVAAAYSRLRGHVVDIPPIPVIRDGPTPDKLAAIAAAVSTAKAEAAVSPTAK